MIPLRSKDSKWSKRGGRGASLPAFFDRHAGTLFILPALLVAVVILAYPIGSSLYYGLTDRNLLSTDFDFVGLANFKDILVDPAFWRAFNNTIVWTAGSVFLQVLLGLVTALLLNRIRWLKGTFRTLLIIPWAFPSIVIAFSWKWLLNDLYGFFNGILLKFGFINEPILWLADPKMAMISVILINTWFGFPLMMVSILASLQTIPKDEYEAAAIDGASSWQSFVYITLKHIRIVVGLLVVLRTIWIFNNFETIFLTTGGGPGTTTETLSLFAYRTGWTLSMIGKASAITTILLVFLLIVTYLYFRILDRWERSDA